MPRKRKPYNKSTGRKYTGNSYDARYNRRPGVMKKRAQRLRARRAMKKRLTKKYGAKRAAKMMKGKDVDHKRTIRKGGSNRKGNLRLMSRKKNRGRNRPTGKKNYPKRRRSPRKR